MHGSAATSNNAARDAAFAELAEEIESSDDPGDESTVEPPSASSVAATYVNGQGSVPMPGNPPAVATGAAAEANESGMVGGRGDLCERFPETCGPVHSQPGPHREGLLEKADQWRQAIVGSYSGYWGNVGQAWKGFFWTAPKEVVTGTVHLVLNPGELVDAAWLIANHPELVPKAIWDDLKEKASSSEGQGQLAGDLALTLIPISKIKELSRIAQLVKKFGKIVPDGGFAPKSGGWIDGMADISKLSKGRKGGVVLDKEWLDQVRAHLKSLDPDLKLKIDDKLLDDLGFRGGFRAGDGTVILRSDATLFEAVHEIGHAKYFADIGSDAGRYLGDVGSASRELEAWRYVLDYADRYPGRFTADELAEARSMFNEEFRKIFGVLPE